MKKMEFYKLQASGNDFILIDQRKNKGQKLNFKDIARKYCSRKLGIGADGLLVIEPSKKASFKMRIINADGSEAEMCGNGARCVSLWAAKGRRSIKFDTVAGIIESKIKGNDIKVKLTDPFDLKLDFKIKVLAEQFR